MVCPADCPQFTPTLSPVIEEFVPHWPILLILLILLVPGKKLAQWATVVGVGGGLIGAYFAINTYTSNSSTKKYELIRETYAIFMQHSDVENQYEFY